VGDGRLDAYRVAVERIFGEDLVSLTLYGGHAADPPEEKGEATVLIVVRHLRRDALAAYRREAPRFAKQGIPPPPIFTEKFFGRSIDVFPLEFLGMKERRQVHSGRAVLADVRVNTANLRHQVEFELKGKLLSLRRLYLSAQGGRALAGVLRRTAGSIVLVARGLLLLSEGTAPYGKAQILSGIESRFRISLPLLREIATSADEKSMAGRAEEIAPGYLEEVALLCEAADLYVAGNAP